MTESPRQIQQHRSSVFFLSVGSRSTVEVHSKNDITNTGQVSYYSRILVSILEVSMMEHNGHKLLVNFFGKCSILANWNPINSVKLSHFSIWLKLSKVYFRCRSRFLHGIRSNSRHLDKLFVSVMTKRNIVFLFNLKGFDIHRVPHCNSV